VRLFGREFTRGEIQKRVGDITQIAGIKPCILKEGKADGVEAFDIKTGSGLCFTVLPGRAMDIAWMEHGGLPVGYISKAGIVHSKYYQPFGKEWLRSFYCGVLTTCGLTHVGPPERDGDEELGLHGRIANIPAEEVSHLTRWEGDDLVLTVRGKMREAVLFGENLTLTREITAYGGESKVIIRDRIENQGYGDTPLMILYHMNMGFPLVSEDSGIVAPILQTTARDEEAQKGIENYSRFEAPTPGYLEQVFFHKVAADADGGTCVGIINESLNFGLYIKYNIKQLPFLTEWKMMGQQDYVLGLEPGNCTPIGRRAAREKGQLEVIKAGEVKEVELELGVMTTWEEIQGYKDYVRKMLK